MTRFSRSCALLLLLGVAAGAAAQEWVEVKSPHFSVVTDAGEKRGREVAVHFEQMRSAFGLLFQRANVNIPVPLQIVAFRRSRELRDMAPLWNGKPVALEGFYQHGEDRDFIALDISSSDWSIVFHEYAHLLINGNLPPTPAWYDEGFAEFCSSLNVSSQRIEFGRVPPGRAQVLSQSAWMRSEDLFSVIHTSREYNEGDRRSVFYAQSTLVVNYLMTNRMGPRLATYLQLAQDQHVPVGEAIQQAFGMAPRDFDRALRNYFNSGRMQYFAVPVSASFASGPLQARPLAELEWQTVLADLRFHSPDHREQGIAEFRRILEKQPENPAANRGVAYAYLLQNDFDHAAPYLRIAARDSSDPRVRYLSALLSNRSAIATGHNLDVSGMRRELQAAIALDPNFADAYNLLAFTEAADGNLEAALAAMRKAAALDPRNLMYQSNLGNYEMHAQHWDAAEAIWNQLLHCDNPEIASHAGVSLSQIAEARLASSRQAATLPLNSSRTAAALPLQEDAARTAPAPAEIQDSTPSPQLQSIRFAKGTLVGVDCSVPPGAVLTIRSAGKRLVMFTRDIKTLLLIGEDTFSCSWKDRKVSVNYRPKSDGRGELVSLELD